MYSRITRPALYGGGIFCTGYKTTQPSITGTLFLNNSADGEGRYGGGAIYVDSSNMSLSKCVFSANASAHGNGGAIYVGNWSPVLTNCVFSANSAEYNGALYNQNCGTHVINCTFCGNTATSTAGASGEYNSTVQFMNCIFWNDSAPAAKELYVNGGSTTVSYCDIQGGVPAGITDGGSNIAVDPKFVNSALPAGANGQWYTSDDGLALSNVSMCIGRGTSAGAPADDILSTPRSNPPTCIGAYENLSTPVTVTGHIFVNASATGANNGTSWTDAFTDLAAALTVAVPANDIWVAAGTYKPGTTRADCFQLKTSVAVYGCFAGGEGSLTDRTNWAAHPTILSGDIGVPGVAADNCYHVVKGAENTTLNGFTIRDGNANGSDGNDQYGAGLYCANVTMTIADCVFTNNSAESGGGGVFTWSLSGTFTNCRFANNSSGGNGGGLCNEGNSNPTLTDCVFVYNSAPQGVGGAVCNMAPGYGACATLTNCVLAGNSASEAAVFFGVADSSSNSSFVNCTIAYNVASGSYAVQCTQGAYPTITFMNCIIWSNTSSNNSMIWNDTWEGGWINIEYTDVQGGVPGGISNGGNNVDLDPQFVSATNWVGPDGLWATADDGLIPTLPASLLVGTSTGAPATDIIGTARLTPPEMGAYEPNFWRATPTSPQTRTRP